MRKTRNAYAGSEPNTVTHSRRTFYEQPRSGAAGAAVPWRSLSGLIASSLNSRLNLRLSMTYLRLMKHLNWVSITPATRPTIIIFFADFFSVGPEVVASEDERRVLHRSPR